MRAMSMETVAFKPSPTGAPIQQVGHILLVPGEGDHVRRAGEIAGHAAQLFVEALAKGVNQPLPMVVGADVFQ
jgi:hypothetical protein